MEPITIVIEDISEGNMKGFSATMPELNNSIAMGGNFKELFEGILLALETAEEEGMGVFADQKKIPQKDISIKNLVDISPPRDLKTSR